MLFSSTEELQLLYYGYPDRIGQVRQGRDHRVHATEDANSGHWSVLPDMPNAYRASQKLLQGHGRKGMLIYRVDNNDENYYNPRKRCRDWYEVRN